jgi:6-pyruvoyltetrahydropterin/6-carboxytetrahydropterin synthase
MIEIVKEFSFDAAHHLGANVEAGHPYAALHGHSFRVEVHLRGAPAAESGWVVDFAAVDAAIEPIRRALDHKLLNEVEGLEVPTLETLSRWIFERMRAALPQTCRVRVQRGSRGEACVYQPDG